MKTPDALRIFVFGDGDEDEGSRLRGYWDGGNWWGRFAILFLAFWPLVLLLVAFTGWEIPTGIATAVPFVAVVILAASKASLTLLILLIAFFPSVAKANDVDEEEREVLKKGLKALGALVAAEMLIGWVLTILPAHADRALTAFGILTLIIVIFLSFAYGGGENFLPKMIPVMIGVLAGIMVLLLLSGGNQRVVREGTRVTVEGDTTFVVDTSFVEVTGRKWLGGKLASLRDEIINFNFSRPAEAAEPEPETETVVAPAIPAFTPFFPEPIRPVMAARCDPDPPGSETIPRNSVLTELLEEIEPGEWLLFWPAAEPFRPLLGGIPRPEGVEYVWVTVETPGTEDHFDPSDRWNPTTGEHLEDDVRKPRDYTRFAYCPEPNKRYRVPRGFANYVGPGSTYVLADTLVGPQAGVYPLSGGTVTFLVRVADWDRSVLFYNHPNPHGVGRMHGVEFLITIEPIE